MTYAERLTPFRSLPARFTADEFMELVQHPPISDWVGRIELVGGEIMRMAPANVPHWNAQRLVCLRLQSALASSGVDWIVGQEPTVRLSIDTLREPDVAILRDPDMSATLFDRRALYLAVEIADTSIRADLGTKRRDYAEALVPHYWVVDLNARVTHVMADPRDGDYAQIGTVRFGEALAVPGSDAAITID